MMNFRDLMNALDNIDKPILSEALTLSAVIALTSGYEQDDKVRIPKLADLAKQNGLEGLVDPVTGNYVNNEGEEEDEVPFEIAEKLSAAGLLPSNARLPQAGWFDNNRVFNAANKNLMAQSSSVADRHELIMSKLQVLRELAKQIIAYRDKRATTKMQDMIGEKPILPSNAPSPELARLTPTFPSQTMAGINESAGLADALLESFEYLYEDLKDQEWSFRRPEVKPKPSETQYLLHPELKKSANTAISDLRQPTTKSLSGGEYNASNLKPSAPATATKAGSEYSKIKGIPLAKDLIAKAGAKSASKFVPLAGTAYGVADAAQRFANKDYVGAGIGGLSTLTSQIPGPLGMASTLGLDAYNLYRDMDEEDRLQAQAEQDHAEKEAPPAEPTKEAPPTAPTKEAPPTNPKSGIIDLQTYLKSVGANLGKTGPNRDGIDGVIGPLTKAAIKQYIMKGKA